MVLTEHERESRNSPTLYSQLIFDEDAKEIKWRNNHFFQQIVLQNSNNHNKKKRKEEI